MTNVDLARWQFAFTSINHFLFVPITIGLAVLTVEAAWEVVDPVLDDVTPVHPYAKGTWGPAEADRLLADRDTWHDPAG
jgi:hypothetical protein